LQPHLRQTTAACAVAGIHQCQARLATAIPMLIFINVLYPLSIMATDGDVQAKAKLKNSHFH